MAHHTLFFLAAVVLSLAIQVTLAVNSVTFNRVFPNYPKKVFEAQGTTLGDKIYVMGGFYKFPGTTKEVYRRSLTTASAEWEKLAPMPEPLTHMAQAVSGNWFCGAGGYLDRHPGKSVSSVLCYHATTNRWVRLPNLPGDRAGGGMVFHQKNGKNELIFAGGVDREFNSLAKHTDFGTTWRLNLNSISQGWQNTGATMPNPRNHMAGVSTCGRYFFVGGQHEESEANGNQDTVSEFLPESNTWKNVAPLPIKLGHISASVISYQCGILVIAGTTQGFKRSSDVFYYSAGTNKWKKVGNLPVACTTPVCGIYGQTVMCATGGGAAKERVYVGELQ